MYKMYNFDYQRIQRHAILGSVNIKYLSYKYFMLTVVTKCNAVGKDQEQ